MVALLFGGFINMRLLRNGGDFGLFVVAGRSFVDPTQLPVQIPVVTQQGYDGQFFFRLALNPFTSAQTADGVRIDTPSWRQQRLIYPLVVWLLSAGQPGLVPPLLVLVNYVALCALALLGVAYSRALGQAPGWGLVLPLYPGFLVSLSRDLAEILEGCFVVAALLAARKGRPALTNIGLSLAVLTRESALLAVAALAADHLIDRRRGHPPRLPLAAIIAPVAVFGVWQALLLLRWGEVAALAGRGDLGLPLAGLAEFAMSVMALDTPDRVRWFVELVFLAAFIGGVAVAARTSTAWRPEGFAWLAYVLLAALFTTMVWVEDIAFMRILADVYVLGALVLIGSRASARTCLFASSAVIWVLLASRLVRAL